MFNLLKTLKYIEIETCSACTRTCKWCLFGSYRNSRPKDNQFLKTEYIKKVIDELEAVNYQGTIALYSINEPLLDERICTGELIEYINQRFGYTVKINVITNGDLLSDKIITIMYAVGLHSLMISCYDNNGYIKAQGFKKRMPQITILDQRRYQNGLWESNRGGVIESAHINLSDEKISNSCFMPFFRAVIGWDGEIRICPHDILGGRRIGNIKESSFFDLLLNIEFVAHRNMLTQSRSNIEPCKNCNVNGSIRYMLEHLNDIEEAKSVLKEIKKGINF